MMQSTPPQMGICAIIVSYNPAPCIIDSVAALAPQVKEIVIVDNGSDEGAKGYLELIERAHGCRIVRNADNRGIASALNTGVRYALDAGYEHIATFDQDSTVPEGFVVAMLSALDACPFKDAVMLVAPRYCDSGTGVISGSAPEGLDVECRELEVAITSGSLFKVEAFSKVGFFDESFFIDCVDHEYCLRLRSNGYRLIEARNAVLQHTLGHMTLHRLLGRKCKVFNHSPLRRYYNARNRIVVYKRYGLRFPAWAIRDFCNFCKEIAGIIMFEQDTIAKLSGIATGCLHGLTGKLGKAV